MGDPFFFGECNKEKSMELDILRRKSGNVNSLISKFAAYDLPQRSQRRHTIVGVSSTTPVGPRPYRAQSTPSPTPTSAPHSTGGSERKESISLILRVINKRRNTLSLSPNLASLCEKENTSCIALSTQDKSKESTINDLKKRAELRKTDHMIKRVNSMPNGGNSMARTARENILAKLGEDPKSKVKLARSNTFASGGATGVKSLLLKWCQARLRSYSMDVTNYSSSWADGAAFCGLIHSFFPDAFDWSQVHESANTEEHRRSNFVLAFDTAHSRADAEPLIEVEDMIFMGNRPDAKCIFCYLQSLYNKLKKFEKLQKPKSDECAV